MDTSIQTMDIDNKLIEKIKSAIDIALQYQSLTNGKRKLGITGEVGEILVCRQFKLKLVLDSRSAGFDAIDNDNMKVQIKTRCSEKEGLPSDKGRVSTFSKHEADYVLLALLDNNYNLCEVWRAEYIKLKPIIDKQKRRNPNLSSIKNIGYKIFP